MWESTVMAQYAVHIEHTYVRICHTQTDTSTRTITIDAANEICTLYLIARLATIKQEHMSAQEHTHELSECQRTVLCAPAHDFIHLLWVLDHKRGEVLDIHAHIRTLLHLERDGEDSSRMAHI